MTPIIEVHQLVKRFRYREQSAYKTLREEIAGFFAHKKPLPQSNFLALNTISFAIQPGEIVGVLGRNGAGKSTLLKILSRITPPTSGWAVVHGRVASLLEVGTGFHPELTGAENIFLNGAILGMKRAEIIEKYAQIVDFAGVEKFLDMPIKHYSSGMQMRLAFSVAAHLNSEILLVDEVLAVGDAEFQKKCLAKMDHVAKSGRTVIFVSHNLASMAGLCQRGLLLDQGKLVADGPITKVIQTYLKQVDTKASTENLAKHPDVEGSKEVVVTKVQILSQNTLTHGIVSAGSPVNFRLMCKTLQPLPAVSFAIGVDNESGTRVATLWTKFVSSKKYSALDKNFVVDCQVSHLHLRPGVYWLTLYIEAQQRVIFHLRQARRLIVEPSLLFHNYPVAGQGEMLIPHTWS